MRISDWSSDVCSSMLGRSSATRTKCVTQAMWDALKIRINDSNIGIGVSNYTAAELNALDGGRPTFYSPDYNVDNFAARRLYVNSRYVLYSYQRSSGARLYYLRIER